MSAENLCVRCGRPTPDGYACADETRKAAEQLRQLVDMLPAARDVAHGLSRRGGGGSTTGKPGSQIPIDLTAMARLDAVDNQLTTWTRHTAEERGLKTPQAGTYSVYAMSDDRIKFAALWLTEHLEWWRHRPEVDEFLTDVDACARVVAGIARGPAPQRYLGPCGAERRCEGLEPDDWPEGDCGDHTPHARHDREPCEGDIYAREGASNGACRLCGAQVSTDARRAWLDAEVRSRAFRAAEIANAYGINVKTIRSWATERQARYDHSGTCVQTARPAKLHPHGHDRDGRPLFLVGDVLDLAAQEAAQREEARAERARRKEASAA